MFFLVPILAVLGYFLWPDGREGQRALEYLHGTAEHNARSPFLTGNAAPVFTEVSAADLPVRGALPEELRNGVFLRNGPNPEFVPTGKYHWFDGAGMLHAVVVADGRVGYANSFARTPRFLAESAAKRTLYPSLGDLDGYVGFAKFAFSKLLQTVGLIPALEERKSFTANTNVVQINGEIYGLVEADLPFKFRLSTARTEGKQEGKPNLTSVGYEDFGGAWQYPFTAHPKQDPRTGETVFFGSYTGRAELQFGVLDAAGRLTSSLTVPVSGPLFAHDCAVTATRTVALDLPFYFRPEDTVRRNGPAVRFDATRPARFGVFPRHARSVSAVQWFNASSAYIYHTVNAWDEGKDQVVLHAVRYASVDFYFAESMPFPQLWEYRFDLRTGATAERLLADVSVEFPRVNERLLGRPTRYAYAATLRRPVLVDGIVKVDLRTGEVVGRITYAEGRYGGECNFVPESDDPAAIAPEDAGYLVTIVYDTATDASEFVVFDARTMAPEPVAAVRLPQRVPYGFHGNWVPGKRHN